MNAMKEDVGRLLLGAWVLVMVVCFLGVENIQAKEPSMDKVELTTELEPDVKGQVDVPAGMDSIALYFEGIRGQQQEKLWLHLNQPYYAAGDTIWFRAYLLDAITDRILSLILSMSISSTGQNGWSHPEKLNVTPSDLPTASRCPIHSLPVNIPSGQIPDGCSTSI